jgi:ABC-type Fe3+/spermidine/putrescine transport system ATPase subunit
MNSVINPDCTAGLGAPLIEIRHVHKRFGEYVAIDDISLGLGEGRFVTLLGPSGCGKTTLLRMIGGLEIPDEGAIRVAGRSVGTFSPIDRPTRMVFQSYALFPHMTVEGNVAYGLRRRRIPEDRVRTQVAEQLEVVGLSEKARAYPAELSGGQQQRVALARALVTKPKVLLLDEPLAALDLKLRQRMQAEIKALQRSAAITFVFVTHDQHEALALSDEIVVMQEGRVAQRGTPADVYHRPSSRYVAEFVGDTTILDGTVIEVTPGGARIETPAGIFSASGTAIRTGEKIYAVIRPEEIRVLPPTPVRPTENLLDAIVESSTYRGADIIVELRAASGVRLQTCVAATTSEASAVTHGTLVTLHLPPVNLWLIPAKETTSNMDIGK